MELFKRKITLEEANNELNTAPKYRKFLVDLHNHIVDLHEIAHDAQDGRVSKANAAKAKKISNGKETS